MRVCIRAGGGWGAYVSMFVLCWKRNDENERDEDKDGDRAGGAPPGNT